MYIAYTEHGTVIARGDDLDKVLAIARAAKEQGEAAWVDVRTEDCPPPREDIMEPRTMSWREQHHADLVSVFRRNQGRRRPRRQRRNRRGRFA